MVLMPREPKKVKKVSSKYFVDQSGKIENTSKDTILCLSNSAWSVVIIKAKVKRQLQEIFRRNGQPRNFILFGFAGGLSILLKKNPTISEVTVDREYFGKESVIKKLVLEMLQDNKQPPEIHFALIGKKAMAHNRAYAAALGKLRKQGSVVSLKQVLEEIKKTEVGKRLKNA